MLQNFLNLLFKLCLAFKPLYKLDNGHLWQNHFSWLFQKCLYFKYIWIKNVILGTLYFDEFTKWPSFDLETKLKLTKRLIHTYIFCKPTVLHYSQKSFQITSFHVPNILLYFTHHLSLLIPHQIHYHFHHLYCHLTSHHLIFVFLLWTGLHFPFNISQLWPMVEGCSCKSKWIWQ